MLFYQVVIFCRVWPLVLSVVAASLTPGVVFAQMGLSNPLMRPVDLVSKSDSDGAAPPAPGGDTERKPLPNEDPEMLKKAESRLTQEDLNIQQQRLNIQRAPTALVDLLASMNVVASYRGGVVLRRPATAGLPNAGQAPAPSNQQPSNSSQSQGTGSTASPSYTSKVLRLKTDKATWLLGYQIRASLSDGDVVIDWYNRDQGQWINVYVGALQPGVASSYVPVELEPVDTGALKYLEPRLGAEISGGGAGGSGGSGSGGGQANGRSGAGVGF